MKWRLYYTDGGTFSDRDGTWDDAPARGVVLLLTESEDVGREIQWGTDYYLWWPETPQPWCVDKAGLWDFLHEIGSPLADKKFGNEDFADLIELGVKFGRNLPSSEFRAMLQRADADPDFPPKSAKGLLEDLR